jgi:hypothetical protein
MTDSPQKKYAHDKNVTNHFNPSSSYDLYFSKVSIKYFFFGGAATQKSFTYRFSIAEIIIYRHKTFEGFFG